MKNKIIVKLTLIASTLSSAAMAESLTEAHCRSFQIYDALEHKIVYNGTGDIGLSMSSAHPGEEPLTPILEVCSSASRMGEQGCLSLDGRDSPRISANAKSVKVGTRTGLPQMAWTEFKLTTTDSGLSGTAEEYKNYLNAVNPFCGMFDNCPREHIKFTFSGCQTKDSNDAAFLKTLISSF